MPGCCRLTCHGYTIAQLGAAGNAHLGHDHGILTDDNVVEATETFLASLNVTTVLDGRSLDDSDTGVGMITDNDTAAVTVGDVTATEGGNLVFTVSLNNAVQGGFDVDGSFTDGTADGSDYANALQTVSFAGNAGEKSKLRFCKAKND